VGIVCGLEPMIKHLMEKIGKTLGMLLIAILVSQFSTGSDKKQLTPNVIFVLVDDVPAAWLPPYAKQLDVSQLDTTISEHYRKTLTKNKFNLQKHMDAARNSIPFFAYYAQETLHRRMDPPPEKYLTEFDTGTEFKKTDIHCDLL